MTRKNLFRIAKSKVLWIFCAIALIVFFAFAAEYSVNASTVENHIAFYVSEYDTIDDIPVYVEELEGMKEELEYSKTSEDYDEDDYQEELLVIEHSIAIYNYLYQNKITYDQFRQLYATQAGMYIKSDNRAEYTEEMQDISSVLLLVLLTLCSTILVCNDFSSDLYKNIYGTNVKRVKIYRSKFLACLIFAAAVLLVLFILTVITSLQFKFIAPYMICFLGDELFVLSSPLYIFLMYIVRIIDLLPYIAVIFGISSMIKNTYLNLLLCTASCLVPYLLSYMTVYFGRNWYVLNMGLIYMFNGYYPSWIFIVVYLAKVIAAFLCCLAGYRRFKSRNL